MAELPHIVLLMHQKVKKRLLVRFFFQLLEHAFLMLGHRTANAMPLAPELADVDAGGRNAGHSMLSSRQNQVIPTRNAESIV